MDLKTLYADWREMSGEGDPIRGRSAQHENEPLAEQDAAEDQQDTENIADGYVYQGSFPVADLEQLKCFPGKGGKGCKTTQKSGKDKKAPLMGPVGFIKDTPDEADEKGPQKIYGKGSGREDGPCKTLDKEKHSVAAGSPERSPCHDC